jgi:hypothetical protein
MNIHSTLSKNIQIITGSITTISLNSAILEDLDTQDKLHQIIKINQSKMRQANDTITFDVVMLHLIYDPKLLVFKGCFGG